MTTSNHFIYSPLRYHDVRREENLIIGVLLIFPAAGKVHFLHPEHLYRLKAAFPDCPEGRIRGYFIYRSKEISQQDNPLMSTVQDASQFIASHFLMEGGLAFPFSVPHLAVIATENLDTVQIGGSHPPIIPTTPSKQCNLVSARQIPILARYFLRKAL